ncbi:MAG: hypothetical protein B7Y70_16010 [Rhizobiales bacterium 35-68-8]|nr:MAG: hypothetical protein B7Y70_16010 [Rhizobiales bacterium 35-68-8]
MVALTYGDARLGNVEQAPQATAAAAMPRKAWYVRLFDAMVAARMQQAEREIRLYTRLMPYTLDESGQRILKTDTNSPVGGW